jgi:hypothetical protein
MTTIGKTYSLRLPATAVLIGQTLYIAVTQLHAGGDANDHHHIFETYAADGIWSAVHLAQFVGMAALLAGIAALLFLMRSRTAEMKAIMAMGIVAAISAFALYGALQAVDGVALKQAVGAWAAADEAEKVARFASAESIRWLEWGMRSYQDFALGLALVLLAIAAASVRLGVAIPVLMGASGIAYFAQGWIAGTEGFTSTQSIAIVAAWALSVAWMSWLALVAWSRPTPEAESVPSSAIA